MCFAVGDGLADGGFEFEPLLDAIADFLYEDAVAAEFVAGVKEFVPGRVVDVVAVENKFQGVELAVVELGDVTEGTVFYDIRFTAIVPNNGKLIELIINIEA